MRRLSSQRVILDILVTHVAARYARKIARTAIRKRLDWEGKASSLSSILRRMVPLIRAPPLFVATNTVPRAPYLLLLLVRFEVPTNS